MIFNGSASLFSEVMDACHVVPLHFQKLELIDLIFPCETRTVGLLAISQHPVYAKRLATPLIIAGTTLFSGSIFALLLYRERYARRLTPVHHALSLDVCAPMTDTHCFVAWVSDLTGWAP